MRLLPAAFLTLVMSWSSSGQTYTISTFAGGGLPVNIAATSAGLDPIYFATADQAGNVFFVDQGSVLRLDATTGVLTLAAGIGTPGFSGDDGPATSSQLNSPCGIAVDSAGNLYIADTNDNRIRKASNGVITTVVGIGPTGFDSGDNGPATGAGMAGPTDIAVDTAGNLFIAEGNCVISALGFNGCRTRKVAGGIITTAAGNGVWGFSGDNGPASAAEFVNPDSVAVDTGGKVYVSDSANNRIRILMPSASSCLFSVSPTNPMFAVGGGNLSFTIQTSASCAWAVQGLPSWITYSGNAVGTGPATITLMVVANTAAARSAEVSIAGVDVSVVQAGVAGSMSISSVTNAASNLSGPVAPGEIVVLYGSGLGPSQLVKETVVPASCAS